LAKISPLDKKKRKEERLHPLYKGFLGEKIP
jgi:hypothetical protein